MTESTTKRRIWIRNAIILVLIALLILTLFSVFGSFWSLFLTKILLDIGKFPVQISNFLFSRFIGFL